jgi:outer membrane lipoprotein-sorting protein
MDQLGSPKRLVPRVFLIALLVFSLADAGCKTVPACPLQARTDPAKALDDHVRQQSGWQSIKAEARVTQWGRHGRIRGNVLMFLQKPNRVRFDLITQLGTAAVFTSDGDIFQLSDLREGVFMQGPTCPENIARLLGVTMDAENVLRLLTGDTPLLESIEQSMECRDGRYVVTLTAQNGTTQEVAFSVDEADRDEPPEAQRLTLRRSTERAPDGKTRWEATYDDHIDVDGHSFPTHLRFVDEVNDADTSVRLKSISVNPDIPEGAFQQAPSPGMVIELASCS